MTKLNSNLSSPIFLLGTQRSGTTLLTRILSAHPDIFIQNELPLETIFTPSAQKKKIINNINVHFKARYKNNIDEFLEYKSKKLWGLKDPQLTEHLDALEQFIPDSKFIIIVRDGRGVVNSYMDNKWGLGTNAYTGALRWEREVEQQLAFKNKYPESCLVIRFEDLIENLEEQLQNICKHLNVEYSPLMLDYHKEKMQYIPNKQNINTNKAPSKNLANKWQNTLTAKQIKIINKYAEKMLSNFNYINEKSEFKLTDIEVFFYKLHQLIIGEIQIQYQLLKIKLRNKKTNKKSTL